MTPLVAVIPHCPECGSLLAGLLESHRDTMFCLECLTCSSDPDWPDYRPMRRAKEGTP